MAGVVDEFQEAFMTDDESYEKIEAQLETIYKEAPEVMDRVFVALCGYSYKTLCEKAGGVIYGSR